MMTVRKVGSRNVRVAEKSGVEMTGGEMVETTTRVDPVRGHTIRGETGGRGKILGDMQDARIPWSRRGAVMAGTGGEMMIETGQTATGSGGILKTLEEIGETVIGKSGNASAAGVVSESEIEAPTNSPRYEGAWASVVLLVSVGPSSELGGVCMCLNKHFPL